VYCITGKLRGYLHLSLNLSSAMTAQPEFLNTGSFNFLIILTGCAYVFWYGRSQSTKRSE